MEYKSFLVLLVVGVVMSLGVMAGDFKIQYPAGTDLFTVETIDGNTTIKNAIISTLFDAESATVYFADDAIEEADISFVTSCAHPNFLYISGNNLVCGGSVYNTSLETIDSISTLLNASYMNVIKGTMTNTKWCVYDSSADTINCNVEPVVDTDTHIGYINIAMLNETDQIFTGTQIFDIIEAEDWTNVSIGVAQITDQTVLYSGGTLTNTNLCVADGTSGAIDCNIPQSTYLTSQQGNDTFIISVDMDDLAELNTQISGDLISSAELNASYINLVKGTMSDGQWCLYDSGTNSLVCNTAPVVDTHMGYTNIAMLNETSNVFVGDVSFTNLIDKGNFTACGEGEIMKYVGSAWTCATESVSGIQDYTNIALTNETNTFNANQIMGNTYNFTLGNNSYIKGTDSDTYIDIDVGGNVIIVLG